MRLWHYLFALVILTVPIQLGKFFFLKDSYVLGLPIDYLAPTIYLSDFFIIATIATFFYQNRSRLKVLFNSYKSYLLAATAFDAYLLVASLILNNISPVSLFFIFKITFFSLLPVITATVIKEIEHKNFLPAAVAISGLWQSTLIFVQFALQHSLNLAVLGERAFDTTTTNIAHLNALGHQLLRPYGTFPHPNVAAAFLIIYLIFYLSLSKKPSKYIVSAIVMGTFLTFSKTALFILVLLLFLRSKSKQPKAVIIALTVIVAVFIISQSQLLPISSIAERLLLSQAALDISLKNPLFGVGLAHFIQSLASLNLYSLSQTRLLQPVHNIFLLITAEGGLIGLVLFVNLINTCTKNLNTHKKALFLVLLVFGSVDHFFLTLHQGQLLLWLSLGFLLSSARKLK